MLDNHVEVVADRRMAVASSSGPQSVGAEDVSHLHPQVLLAASADQRNRHLDFDSDSARAIERAAEHAAQEH